MTPIFQRVYCYFGLLALALVNARLYDLGPGATWEDQLGAWFVSGLFMTGGVFVGIAWTVTALPPAEVRR